MSDLMNETTAKATEHATPSDSANENGHPDLLYNVEGDVATITFNRPASLNALSPRMSAGIVEMLKTAERDKNVGVVVLTGAGRGFSAGGDIKQMKGDASGDSFETQVADLLDMSQAVKALYNFPKVTVARIHGIAVGAGLCLALACDFRMATTSTRFSTAFSKIGLSGDFAGTFLLARLVGPVRARELFLTGEMFDGRRALELGIISAACEDAELNAKTEALIAELANGSWSAQWTIKQNFKALEAGSFDASLEYEAINQIRSIATADHNAAIKAFVEKQPISFARGGTK